MRNGALGLIETYGYTGAIEAADIAVKTACVELLGVEKVKGGLVTVHITGDVGAVKAAVDAGAAACGKLGALVGAHVIPRPDGSLQKILPMKKREEALPPKAPSAERNPSQEKEDFARPAQPEAPAPPDFKEQDEIFRLKDFAAMKVVALRNHVRKLDGFPMPNKQIKYANKQQLMEALEAYYQNQGREPEKTGEESEEEQDNDAN